MPFLSIGDDLDSRTLRAEGSSERSGEYVVEDVMTDGHMMRRLIFLANKYVIQSEARLSRGEWETRIRERETGIRMGGRGGEGE